ncbi:MAG: hypothetical protein Q7T71_00630, partial [Herbiconiux sp.]|nr:hypothetical protein [Herbiconiux sp.]
FIVGALALAATGPAVSALLPSRANASGVRPGGFETWHEHPLAGVGGNPGAILCDATDTLWYVDDANHQLVRFPAAAPASHVSFDLGPGAPFPGDLVTGGDGCLWFNDFAGSNMGRFDPLTGATTLLPLGGPGNAFSPVLGPDGAIWFADPENTALGAIAADGIVRRFTDARGQRPNLVASPGDGRLWYTRDGVPMLVRFDPATGASDELAVGSGSITGLAVDPSGGVWVGQAGAILHVDRADVVTEFPLPSSIPFWPGVPTSLVAGVHARLYFTDEQLGLGRLDPSGTVLFQHPPFTDATPARLAVTTVGTLWYTDPTRATLGSL